MQNLGRSIIQAVVVTFIGLSLIGNLPMILAQVMSSDNFSIQFDSVNTGGGLSSSDSFKLEDTVGEIATGTSSSATYKLNAGYQQMNEVYLAMTAAANVTMSPTLGGITGGTSNGSTVVTVTTDSPAGYSLYIKASTSPAMQGDTTADSIANYTRAGANPDFTFSVPASDAEFAFTPEGADIAAEYRDNGSACNVGSGDTANACWGALTTADELIARRSEGNHPSGLTTTIKFRLEIGSSAFKLEDTYTATTTLTAVSN